MGRINKSTEGVFINLIGSRSTRPLYEQFINQESPEGDQDGEYGLAEFINSYKSKVTEHKTSIHQLAVLEIIIMQMRTRSNYKDSVKLYFMKKSTGATYIYARPEFMQMVYDEMEQWMDAEIDENVRNYKKVYQN